MRAYGDIRLLIVKQGAFKLYTDSIVLAEWPRRRDRHWVLFAVDPEDELALLYWQEQGAPPLQCLT